MPHSHSDDDSDEVSLELQQASGFLLLEDCEVVFDVPEFTEARWLMIDSTQSTESSQDHRISSGACCEHCQLVLRWEEDYESLMCEDPSQFDGTLLGTEPDPAYCTCRKTREQRSDAALLVGLASTCESLGHITVLDTKAYYNGTKGQARTVLFITFATTEFTNQMRHSRVIEGESRKFISKSSKMLPDSTQLLLSIMRNDFKYLDRVIRQPETVFAPQSVASRSSFFPSEFSLAEVYKRIGGSLLPLDDLPTNPILPMLNPTLIRHIASFLQARSLDALRCCSKDVHSVLGDIVPGLKLRLYDHQVKSLAWMRNRETRLQSECHMAPDKGGGGGQFGYLHGKGERQDIHRAASGGATVLLRCPADGEDRFVRVSQHNGNEVIIQSEDVLPSRSVARGGLLCDDPGLGKTITVIALILQTLGLSTASSPDEAASREDDSESCQSEDTGSISDDSTDDSTSLPESESIGDSCYWSDCKPEVETVEENVQNEQDSDKDQEVRIFAKYWKEVSDPQLRCHDLNKLLSEFLRQNPDSDDFYSPVDPVEDGVPDYYDVISSPICFEEIRHNIELRQYVGSFDSFEEDVARCFSNAIEYHPPNHPITKAANRLINVFREMTSEFKQQQIGQAKRAFGRASAKPDSATAALVQHNNLTKLKRSLVPSSGTLLVVPSVLVEHWQEQLHLHVNLDYITALKPEVCIFPEVDIAGTQWRCKEAKTHSPFIFIDKSGTKELPPPSFLAMFQIVITTNQRFTNEWKNGSFEEELKRDTLDKEEDVVDYRMSLSKSLEACSLLKVNWLRMIVDEGHSMGRGKRNCAISFASWIMAERKWAMTGTPTRQIASQSGLSNVLHLLQYLQHEFLSPQGQGENEWKRHVVRRWNSGALSGFFRLRSILRLLMVRHSKDALDELPPPEYQTTVLEMSDEEVKTYNTLVCGVQANILLTGMKGETSGAQDSFLHRSQARHAKQAMRNLRLVCVGGTEVIPTLEEKNRAGFLEMYEKLCRPSEDTKSDIVQYLDRASSAELSACAVCGIMVTQLLVFPCGDLVCAECVDTGSHCCLLCHADYDVDAFQRLQPGMHMQWRHNIEQRAKKKVSTTPPSPLEEKRAQSPKRKRRPVHKCTYDFLRDDGKCVDCGKEHEPCNLMNYEGYCPQCYRESEVCPTEESKSSYLVDRLSDLHENAMNRPQDHHSGYHRRPLKAIVFSQFRQVLNMVGNRLLRAFGTACVAEYWGQYRRQELHRFTYENSCFCMLLGKDGNEGLDLSFVTHIFFLEQVWDKPLEQQTVARAWRMGASGPVKVETLIASDSVEETVNEMEHRLACTPLGSMATNSKSKSYSYCEASPTSSSERECLEYQQSKLSFLLKGLKLIRSSSFARRTPSPSRAARHPAQRKAPPSNEEEIDTTPPRKKRKDNPLFSAQSSGKQRSPCSTVARLHSSPQERNQSMQPEEGSPTRPVTASKECCALQDRHHSVQLKPENTTTAAVGRPLPLLHQRKQTRRGRQVNSPPSIPQLTPASDSNPRTARNSASHYLGKKFESQKSIVTPPKLSREEFGRKGDQSTWSSRKFTPPTKGHQQQSAKANRLLDTSDSVESHLTKRSCSAQTETSVVSTQSHQSDPALLESFRYVKRRGGERLECKLASCFQHWMKVQTPGVLDVISGVIDDLGIALLMVDELEDKSKQRRRIPVAHSIFGIPSVVNSASYASLLAIERCNRLNSPEVAQIVVGELLNVHRGVGRAIKWREDMDCPTEEQYMEVVTDKTGGMFRLIVRLMQTFSCQEHENSLFVDLANSLALYSQLRDDYIRWGDETCMESTSLEEELTERGFSFPMVHCIHLDSNDTRLLTLMRKRAQAPGAKGLALQILLETGSLRRTIEKHQELKDQIVRQVGTLGGNLELLDLVDELDIEFGGDEDNQRSSNSSCGRGRKRSRGEAAIDPPGAVRSGSS